MKILDQQLGAAMHETEHTDRPPFDGRPNIECARNVEYNTAYDQFQEYLSFRRVCLESMQTNTNAVDRIKADTSRWVSGSGLFDEGLPYGSYCKKTVEKNLGGLMSYLSENHPEVSKAELATTRKFVDSVFAMYESSLPEFVSDDENGTAAFIVHIRTSKAFPDYDAEIDPVIPALRYVPGKLRASFMVGLPPFVIDQYVANEQGKKAYLVCAPFYIDSMLEGIESHEDFQERHEIAVRAVQDSVDYARKKLGTKQIGLGAVLPSITQYGQKIDSAEAIITTGHGGTAALIKQSANLAVERGYVDSDGLARVGILGLGSIGASVADVMLDELKNSKFFVYDQQDSKIVRTISSMQRRIDEFNSDESGTVQSAENEKGLIEESSIIISAITQQLDLYKLFGISPHDSNKPQVLKGKFIIDDSQPASFLPEQVHALGGRVTWVVGRDTKGAIAREGYDYGTMSDEKDLFGCESEVNALALYATELSERGMPKAVVNNILGKVAIRQAVTPAATRLISALFKKYGIEPADFQAFGTTISPPTK